MITSKNNPKIQKVRNLIARRQARDEQGLFAAEGVRLLEEAIQFGWQAELVLFSQELSDRGRRLLSGFEQHGSEIEEVPQDLLRSLADTETPQGILAVLKHKPAALPTSPDLVLVIDQVRDPGNLGTILRSAASSAVQAVLLTPGTTDPFSPKVVRAGMGAHFRLPLLTLPPDQVIRYTRSPKPTELQLAASAVDNGTPCWNVDFTRPTALVIGGEAAGVHESLLAAAHVRVTIPMPGATESLNAATATSILLYEITRQRARG